MFQVIHMKNQALFFSKDKSKKLKRSGYLQLTVNSQKTLKWLFTVNWQ